MERATADTPPTRKRDGDCRIVAAHSVEWPTTTRPVPVSVLKPVPVRVPVPTGTTPVTAGPPVPVPVPAPVPARNRYRWSDRYPWTGGPQAGPIYGRVSPKDEEDP